MSGITELVHTLSSLSDVEKEKQAALEREAKRLTMEPFKTMIAPTNKETIDALRDWQEPATAYVLLERKGKNIVGVNRAEQSYSLMTLDLWGRPMQPHKLQYYVTQKGYKILHYGKFPKHNDPNPVFARAVKLHQGPDGRNPWDDMANNIQKYMNPMRESAAQQAIIASKDQQIQDLEARLAAAEAAAGRPPAGQAPASNQRKPNANQGQGSQE